MLSVLLTSADQAVDQAMSTADNYASRAITFLADHEYTAKWPPEAKAQFIAAYMKAAAMDFYTISMLSAAQHMAEIKEPLEGIANAISSISEQL